MAQENIAAANFENTAAAHLAWDKVRLICPSLPEKWELRPEHVKQLSDSGIDPIAACVAGIFSVDAKTAEQLTGYRRSGLAFLYFTPSGKELYKYKAENELKPFIRLRPDITDGKVKYLSPEGSGTFAYWPRTTEQHWKQLNGKRLIITEGEKKALCMSLAGWPTIGLGGVSSYRLKGSEEPLIDGLWRDADLRQAKSLTVIYDSDITHKTEVQRNIGSFAKALIDAYLKREHEERGEQVMPTDTRNFSRRLQYCLLPSTSSSKCGLDDAFIKFGREAISELLGSPLPLIHCEIEFEGGSYKLKKDVMFAPEPCGDQAHKETPSNLQKHVRSLLTWLTLKDEYINVPGVCYYRYNRQTGLWQPLKDKEQWEATTEQAADLNHWRNRSAPLRGQALSMITNRLMVNASNLDKPHLLAFTNGVLNFGTNKLESQQPDHLLTRRLGFNYDPYASCMTWLKWLSWVFDNSIIKLNLIRALFRWSFTPKTDDKFAVEAYPILIGKPGYGKGTFLQILIKLAGESYGTFTYDSLISETGRFKMLGKLVTVNTDLKGRLTSKPAGVINTICSNEPVEIRRLFKNGSDARLGTVLWAAMNRPLGSNEQDREGIDRRIIYLRFKKKPQKKDPFFSRRLEADLPGIFNWLWSMPVEEAIETINQYRHSPEAMKDHEEFLADRNTVYDWLSEVNHESAVTLPLLNLHEVYVEWANKARYSPLGKRNFAAALNDLGAVKLPRRKDGVYYTIPAFKELDIKSALGI